MPLENPTRNEMKIVVECEKYNIDAEDEDEFDIYPELEDALWYLDNYFEEEYKIEMTNEFGETTGIRIDLYEKANIIIGIIEKLEKEKNKAQKFIEICNKYDLKSFDLINRN